ncbi:hypothetical protein NMG60_11031524 [Bertholletia excelsa]
MLCVLSLAPPKKKEREKYSLCYPSYYWLSKKFYTLGTSIIVASNVKRNSNTSGAIPMQELGHRMKNELDHSGEETSMSSRGPPGPPHNQISLPTMHPTNFVFSNALSSPVRQSLQNYHLTQGGYNTSCLDPSANGFKNNETNLNDSFMDMHADSPSH